MKFIGYMFITIVLTVLSIMYNGLAVSKIWNWLVAPLFTVQEISVMQAIAFAFLTSFLTHTRTISKDDGRPYHDQLVRATSVGVAYPTVAIAIAYIIKLFI